MKLVKTASGTQVKLSKKEWQDIGKTAGWMKEAGLVTDTFKKAIQWLQRKYPSEFSKGQDIASQVGNDSQKMAELLGIDVNAISAAMQDAGISVASPTQQTQTANSCHYMIRTAGFDAMSFAKKHWKSIGIVGVVAILAIVFGPQIAEVLQGGGAEALQGGTDAVQQELLQTFNSLMNSLSYNYSSLAEMQNAEMTGELPSGFIDNLVQDLLKAEGKFVNDAGEAIHGRFEDIALNKINMMLRGQS